MKRKRDSFETVLVDGGIRLAPGAWVSFHVDTPFEPSLHQLQAWMLRTRGAVLSDIFGIENDLILLRLADEFGTVDHSAAPAKYFGREQNLREEHSLERQIGAAKPIARDHFKQPEADALIQDLASCREVRNLMAHYPSWLEPVNDVVRGRTVGLRLFIGDRNHIWELQESDVAAWGALFVRVRRQLIRLRHRLTGDPEPDFVEDSFVTKAPGS